MRRAPLFVSLSLVLSPIAFGAGCSGDDAEPATDAAAPSPDTQKAVPDTRAAGPCANNPLINSCFAPMLADCWAPDLSGTCSDTGLEVSWSDGHKIVRTGGNAGFYSPGGSAPCVVFSYDVGTATTTYTKGSDTITDVRGADGVHTVTCPDGNTFTYTDAEGTESNLCTGVACP